MHPIRKRRLYLILFMLLGLFLAVLLALYALRANINLFYSPSQLLMVDVAKDQPIDLGGMVKKKSMHKHQLSTTFIITDYAHEVSVRYHGILPDLFREGQAVIVKGTLNAHGLFIAQQVLAKHDATYTPKAVKEEITQATQNKTQAEGTDYAT